MWQIQNYHDSIPGWQTVSEHETLNQALHEHGERRQWASSVSGLRILSPGGDVVDVREALALQYTGQLDPARPPIMI